MKLGPVTKLVKRNKTTSKNFYNDFMSANCGVIVTFLIYGRFGAIWKLEFGRIVCKPYIFIIICVYLRTIFHVSSIILIIFRQDGGGSNFLTVYIKRPFVSVSFVLKPANPKQMHIRINNNIGRILKLLDERSIRPSVCTDTEVKRFQWNELPSFIDPSEGQFIALRHYIAKLTHFMPLVFF